MVIAIMGDTYARVQSNSIAADSRALAELLFEMEQIARFYFKHIKFKKIDDTFFYCFCSFPDDGEEDEEWEGVVG